MTTETTQEVTETKKVIPLKPTTEEQGKAAQKAKAEAGVLLPDVDPVIGEMLLTTLYGNPGKGMAEIVAGLLQEAPSPEIAIEIVAAAFELALCATKGELTWLEDSGKAILIGARRSLDYDGLQFGAAFWPMAALLMGPPIRHSVRLEHGARSIYIAGASMEGIAVKQSEAIAIGNATIEAFGGRIVEDREGPDVMRQSFIEGNMTKKAKARAEAMKQVTAARVARGEAVKSTKPKAPRAHHARAAFAEALPGTMKKGDRVWNEDGGPRQVFEVEHRINESWVMIVSVEEKVDRIVACAWLPEGQEEVVDNRYVGFTDEPVE